MTTESEKEMLARSRRLSGDFRTEEERQRDQDRLFTLTPEMAEAIAESVRMMPGGCIGVSVMDDCGGRPVSADEMAARLRRFVKAGTKGGCG